MSQISLLITLFCLFGVVCSAAESKKPNILFILTEDQGAHLSYLGTPGLQTPNMDSLAKSGVYFQNFFVGYPVGRKAAVTHTHA